jgi:hypothetical protein
MPDVDTSNANPATSFTVFRTLVAMIQETHYAIVVLQAKRRFLGQKRELQEGCIMFAGWEDVTIMMFAGMIRRGRLQWMRASWNSLQDYTLFDCRELPGGKLLAWCPRSLKGAIGSLSWRKTPISRLMGDMHDTCSP